MAKDDGDEAYYRQAKEKFETALQSDSTNMRARVGLKRAEARVKQERDKTKRARKLALVQKKHGDNWKEALMTETPSTLEVSLPPLLKREQQQHRRKQRVADSWCPLGAA